MPLHDSVGSARLPKTKTFELDGRAWMTDESTFRILEQQTSLGTETTGSWYFAFCLGAGTIIPAPFPETKN
ncbi:MAG TPA: hypothetical protein VGJ06_08850 [Candidatus Acidoferrum sp.]|jgi:hypothetical protein